MSSFKDPRTVLMVNYFFPPLGGAPTLRSVKFARYLPDYQWQPVVLSTRNSPYPKRDPDLFAQLPDDLPIYRSRTLEPAHIYPRSLRLRIQKKSSVAPGEPSNADDRPSLTARIQALLLIPDERIGWLPSAVHLGKKAIRREQPSVIFSSSGPPTAHLVGRRLALWSNLPWVIEFRDPWIDYTFQDPPTRLHRKLDERMEAACVHLAHRVICATPLMTEEMRLRYADEPPEKFLSITNGFDPTDFARDVTPSSEHFLIRYVGSLYGSQTALPFLKGLAQALQQNTELRDSLRVEFIGMMDRRNEDSFDAFVEARQLHQWVSRHPFVPHAEALRLMQTTQVQLLILGFGKRIERVYTTKLFEYLGAKRPILAVTPPGLAANLIRDQEAGVVADRDDPQSIADAILTLYKSFQNGSLSEYAPDDLEPFTRQYQARQLADVLDHVVKTHPHAMG